MSRINTNIESLIARRAIGINNESLNETLERLSSGLRVNRGKEDPADPVTSDLQEAGSLNTLEVTNENVAAAGNAIRDAEFAVETSRLTRARILASSSISVLQLDNAQPRVGFSAHC